MFLLIIRWLFFVITRLICLNEFVNPSPSCPKVKGIEVNNYKVPYAEKMMLLSNLVVCLKHRFLNPLMMIYFMNGRLLLKVVCRSMLGQVPAVRQRLVLWGNNAGLQVQHSRQSLAKNLLMNHSEAILTLTTIELCVRCLLVRPLRWVAYHDLHFSFCFFKRILHGTCG